MMNSLHKSFRYEVEEIMSEKQKLLRKHSQSYVDERFLIRSHKIFYCSNQLIYAMSSQNCSQSPAS